MSQLSSASSASEGNAEHLKRALAQDFLRRFHARQRREIENLNRSVEAAVQERDNGTEAMVANSLARYDQAAAEARAFFESSQGGGSTQVSEAQEQLERVERMRRKRRAGRRRNADVGEKICQDLITSLEREALLVDPDDAEATAEELAKDYANSSRRLTQWRRQLVKDNHKALEEHREKLRDAVNPGEIVKAAMVIMKAAV